MTTTEAATRYGVSQRTVERWCTRDGLPHTRNGKHGRIALDQQAVAAWLRLYPAKYPCCQQEAA